MAPGNKDVKLLTFNYEERKAESVFWHKTRRFGNKTYRASFSFYCLLPPPLLPGPKQILPAGEGMRECERIPAHNRCRNLPFPCPLAKLKDLEEAPAESGDPSTDELFSHGGLRRWKCSRTSPQLLTPITGQ